MKSLEGRTDDGIEIAWCLDTSRAGEAAAFFVANTDPAYISHSELQFGRAVAPGRWAPDLLARVEREASRAIANGREAGPLANTRLALAREGDAILGMAFVTFTQGAIAPFAVLEDLLIASAARGRGLGTAFLDWVAAACRIHGVRRLFLESGLANEKAHHFFEAHGFQQTSIVMMRDLADGAVHS